MPAHPASYPLFRRVLRALRLKRGWTQEQLAERSGCDYKHLQAVERGRTGSPKLELVQRLAKALGTKPWIMLCDDRDVVIQMTQIDPAFLSQRMRPRPGRPSKTA